MGNRTDLLTPDEAGLAAAGFLTAYTGRTLDAYRQDLAQWFGWCRTQGLEVLAVKRVHIELFIRWLADDRGYAAKTVDRRASTVCAFYRSAMVDDYLERNPAEHVRRPKVPTESQTLGLTFVEFAMFLAAAEDLGPNQYGLSVLMGMLGLRVSEACAVDLEDFGEERGHQVLRMIGKGAKPAVVPLPVPIVRALASLREGRTTGPLLRTRTGSRMDRSAARRAMTAIAAKAHIDKHVHPHVLRHTYVTQLLDGGVSLRDVQIAARHADPRMTVRYDRARGNLDRHANYALAARMST